MYRQTPFQKRRKSVRKLGKIVYIAVIVILIGVFGFSAFQVGSYFLASRQQQNEFDELAAMKEQAAQQATATEETTLPPETEPVLPPTPQTWNIRSGSA